MSRKWLMVETERDDGETHAAWEDSRHAFCTRVIMFPAGGSDQGPTCNVCRNFLLTYTDFGSKDEVLNPAPGVYPDAYPG